MKHMNTFNLIASDYRANPRNWKGFLILVLYRLAHANLYTPAILKPLSVLYVVFYKLFTEIILGTEIHWRAQIGHSARIYHGYGLVVHFNSVIGNHVLLRHGVTIGEKETDGVFFAPVLGNNVNVGASAII